MATGDTLYTLTALNNEPAVSTPATFAFRNGHPVILFDPSTDESAVFTAILPKQYAAGGVNVDLHISMTTDVTGDTDWDVSFERIGVGQQDIDTDGFATPQSTDNTTVPGTAGFVQIITVPFTNGAQMDGLLITELFRIKVTRGATGDTATDTAEFHALEIREA